MQEIPNNVDAGPIHTHPLVKPLNPREITRPYISFRGPFTRTGLRETKASESKKKKDSLFTIYKPEPVSFWSERKLDLSVARRKHTKPGFVICDHMHDVLFLSKANLWILPRAGTGVSPS